ncbi:MAG: HD domain-containing protein [Clostridia bacterium]|nr:HD domain-containing protein [Clostridia bacterium]
MDRNMFRAIENHMIKCMDDSAHDREHVYRVLYNALEIAKDESDVDRDILVIACLLHDIGRKEQFENPGLCHARVGAEKAYRFLLEIGFSEIDAGKVKRCIQTHRYRKNDPPASIEARILYDADKLDVTGALGIARTLLYKGIVSEPLYTVTSDGTVSTGEHDTEPSFLQEYKYKLENIYDKFRTSRGREIAGQRREAAVSFYRNIVREVTESYTAGHAELDRFLAEENGERSL